MSPPILDLFDRLKSGDALPLTQIAVLLDRATNDPGTDEVVCKTYLPEELLALQLSPSEVEEIIDRATDLLCSGELPVNSKASLFGIICSHYDAKCQDRLLRFFLDYSGAFSEQWAYSCMASLSLYLTAFETELRLTEALAKYNTWAIAQKFGMHPSSHVQQAARRLINTLNVIERRPSRLGD